jgi:hypothetical protein
MLQRVFASFFLSAAIHSKRDLCVVVWVDLAFCYVERGYRRVSSICGEAVFFLVCRDYWSGILFGYTFRLRRLDSAEKYPNALLRLSVLSWQTLACFAASFVLAKFCDRFLRPQFTVSGPIPRSTDELDPYADLLRCSFSPSLVLIVAWSLEFASFQSHSLQLLDSPSSI